MWRLLLLVLLVGGEPSSKHHNLTHEKLFAELNSKPSVQTCWIKEAGKRTQGSQLAELLWTDEVGQQPLSYALFGKVTFSDTEWIQKTPFVDGKDGAFDIHKNLLIISLMQI